MLTKTAYNPGDRVHLWTRPDIEGMVLMADGDLLMVRWDSGRCELQGPGDIQAVPEPQDKPVLRVKLWGLLLAVGGSCLIWFALYLFWQWIAKVVPV